MADALHDAAAALRLLTCAPVPSPGPAAAPSCSLEDARRAAVLVRTHAVCVGSELGRAGLARAPAPRVRFLRIFGACCCFQLTTESGARPPAHPPTAGALPTRFPRQPLLRRELLRVLPLPPGRVRRRRLRRAGSWGAGAGAGSAGVAADDPGGLARGGTHALLLRRLRAAAGAAGARRGRWRLAAPGCCRKRLCMDSGKPDKGTLFFPHRPPSSTISCSTAAARGASARPGARSRPPSSVRAAIPALLWPRTAALRQKNNLEAAYSRGDDRSGLEFPCVPRCNSAAVAGSANGEEPPAVSSAAGAAPEAARAARGAVREGWGAAGSPPPPSLQREEQLRRAWLRASEAERAAAAALPPSHPALLAIREAAAEAAAEAGCYGESSRLLRRGDVPEFQPSPPCSFCVAVAPLSVLTPCVSPADRGAGREIDAPRACSGKSLRRSGSSSPLPASAASSPRWTSPRPRSGQALLTSTLGRCVLQRAKEATSHDVACCVVLLIAAGNG